MTFGPVFGRTFGVFERHAVAATVAQTGWWTVSGKTCVAAYQPKGAASYAASRGNLVYPGTHDAYEGTAPDWTTGTGWTFDAANDEYLRTGIAIPNDQTYTLLVCFANSGSDDYAALAGAWDGSGGSNRFWLAPKWGSVANWANGGEYQVSPVLTEGVMGIAGDQAYLDGSLKGTIIYASGTNGNELYIGTASNLGNYVSGDISALALYSATLSAAEIATVSAAMAAL